MELSWRNRTSEPPGRTHRTTATRIQLTRMKHETQQHSLVPHRREQDVGAPTEASVRSASEPGRRSGAARRNVFCDGKIRTSAAFGAAVAAKKTDGFFINRKWHVIWNVPLGWRDERRAPHAELEEEDRPPRPPTTEKLKPRVGSRLRPRAFCASCWRVGARIAAWRVALLERPAAAATRVIWRIKIPSFRRPRNIRRDAL